MLINKCIFKLGLLGFVNNTNYGTNGIDYHYFSYLTSTGYPRISLRILKDNRYTKSRIHYPKEIYEVDSYEEVIDYLKKNL